MCGAGSSARHASASAADRSPSAVSHATCQPATASAQSATGSLTVGAYGLGAQHDFERGAEPRLRGERESTVDRLRACANVLQALSCGRRFTVEAFAVVTDEHEALVIAHADHDLGPRRVRVLAHVGQAF